MNIPAEEAKRIAAIYFENYRYRISSIKNDKNNDEIKIMEENIVKEQLGVWRKLESYIRFRYIFEQLLPHTVKFENFSFEFTVGDQYLDHKNDILLFDWLFHSVDVAMGVSEVVESFERSNNELETLLKSKKELSDSKRVIRLIKNGSYQKQLHLQEESWIPASETKAERTNRKSVLKTAITIMNELICTFDDEIDRRKGLMEFTKSILTKTKGREAQVTAFVRTLSEEFELVLNSRLDGTVASITNALWDTDLSASKIRDKLKVAAP